MFNKSLVNDKMSGKTQILYDVFHTLFSVSFFCNNYIEQLITKFLNHYIITFGVRPLNYVTIVLFIQVGSHFFKSVPVEFNQGN